MGKLSPKGRARYSGTTLHVDGCTEIESEPNLHLTSMGGKPRGIVTRLWDDQRPNRTHLAYRPMLLPVVVGERSRDDDGGADWSDQTVVSRQGKGDQCNRPPA